MVGLCLLWILGLFAACATCTAGGNRAKDEAVSLADAAQRMLRDCAPATFSATCTAMRLHETLVELESRPGFGKYEDAVLFDLYVRSSLGQPSEGRVVGGFRYARKIALVTVDFRDEGDGWAAYAWEAGDLGPLPSDHSGWVTWTWSSKLSERS